METLKILARQPDPCIRNYKQSFLMKQMGHQVFLSHSRPIGMPLPTFILNGYNRIINHNSENALAEFIKKEKFDIIHTHNSPDNITLIIRDRVPESTIIHDIHDLQSAYTFLDNSEIDTMERISFRAADGIVCVSDMMKQAVLQKYPELANKQYHVLPNFMMKELVPKIDKPRLSEEDGKLHIAYEGGIASQSSHRNYFAMWQELANSGVHVHIHPFNNLRPEELKFGQGHPFIHMYNPLPTPQLMEQLTKYDFGYVGYSDNAFLMHMALPNKLFEYASAGLAVAAQPYVAIKDWVTKNKMGFIWNNVQELLENMEKWRGYREQKLFLMDDHAKDIYKHYKAVLDAKASNNPPASATAQV